VGSLELVAGLMLIAGLATRLVALALAADMVGAISTAGRLDGGPVNLGLAPILLAVMLLLVWAGAGALSLDGRLVGSREPGLGAARRPALLALLALGGVLALSLASAAPASAESATLTVRDSDYGRVLFDGRGRALYVFTRDPAGRSACSGACARAWPPYLVTSTPKAGRAVRAGLIGTTRRSDGTRQATYAGRPLYYYVGDNGPGVIRCQNVLEFGGLWLVQRPNGRPVR
jgi:predicted lipoprotein with Yx(FWY)xxD motif